MADSIESLGWIQKISLFIDAISDQADYADTNGLSWDRFGSITTYICLVYGITTMLVALLLNRTVAIASTSAPRRQTRSTGLLNMLRQLEWPKIMAVTLLRALAIILLGISTYNVLVTISVLGSVLDASYLTRLTAQYLHYDPAVYFDNKYMCMPKNEVRFGPTSDMLWPVYLSVCYLLFVETFSLAVNGKKPFLEGGISLFELSLAIQEVSSGLFFLRSYKIAKRPSEQVLMVCLFLLIDHIQGHIGSVLYDNRYRLIPLTVLNVGFLWYFVSCILHNSLFSFPISIAITYLCLVFVVVVIVICSLIFVLAIIAKGARFDELNYASYFSSDEGSEFFARNLGCTLRDDFYTAAINVGLFAISLAGKSSYITEYNYVNASPDTWLERSLWERLQATFNVATLASLSELVTSGKVLAYLKANSISGYGNVISTPSAKLISSAEKTDKKPGSSIKHRVLYLQEIAKRLGQLLGALLWDSFALQFVPRLFRKVVLRRSVALWDNDAGPETEEEFEARRARAPAFVQRLMKRRTPQKETFDLTAVSEEDLQEGYASILQNQELGEIDESPDYGFKVANADDDDESSDSEWEEEIDLSLGQVLRPLGELVAEESLVELIESPDILHHHLHYDYSEVGMMTRARYRAVIGPQNTDEAQALLSLILTKRNVERTDGEELNSRLACVICQYNTREIITWPCKCFAICESCRLSLLAKGIEGCVCCRQEVEGVSKVYLP